MPTSKVISLCIGCFSLGFSICNAIYVFYLDWRKREDERELPAKKGLHKNASNADDDSDDRDEL